MATSRSTLALHLKEEEEEEEQQQQQQGVCLESTLAPFCRLPGIEPGGREFAQTTSDQGSHIVTGPIYAPSGGYNKNLLLLLATMRGRSWVCHPGVTRPRLDPPVKPRGQQHRMRHSV